MKNNNNTVVQFFCRLLSFSAVSVIGSIELYLVYKDVELVSWL